MSELNATKNRRVYIVDALKIAGGVFLSAVIIIIILIFRKSTAFINGKYSLLDFHLLFLLLTCGLAADGIRSWRNHKKMPEIMLTYENGKFVILGEEVALASVKTFSGRFEFGRTGTVILSDENKTYKLYGVTQYAHVIRSIEKIVTGKEN